MERLNEIRNFRK